MIVCHRAALYMPIVIAGYWCASRGLFARIHIPRRRPWVCALAAAAILVGVYFLRAIPLAKTLDALWAPVFAVSLAALFHFAPLAPLRTVVDSLGRRSMGIWFLHALFFTHSTRGLFLPLVAWIPEGWWRVAPILALSWLMAIGVDKAFSALERIPLPSPAFLARK